MANLFGTYVIWGPPGTGKTTLLAKQVDKIVRETPVRDDYTSPVSVCSLTRTAAAEIAGRGLSVKKHQIGTLHALAYRRLGVPPIAETMIEEWNGYKPEYGIEDDTVRENVDDMPTEKEKAASEKPGTTLYADYCLYRARMVDKAHWRRRVRSFAHAWEDWKEQVGCIDFTDMIELALKDVATAPGNPDVLVGDEIQDLSKLELSLIGKWGKAAGALLIAGDPWQCQPPGTMVSVQGGSVPIEELNPRVHKLVTFHRQRSQKVTCMQSKQAFNRVSRFYCGKLFRLQVFGRMSTRCTPEHFWTVKIRKGCDNTFQVIYMMEEGGRWRVGSCNLFVSNRQKGRQFGPSAMAYQEGADRVWVLKLCETVAEAEAWQQIVSCKYGIPMTRFRGYMNKRMVELVYNNVVDVCRPTECLMAFGRDQKFPFWTNPNLKNPNLKNQQHIGERDSIVVPACNLIPEIMEVPVLRTTLSGSKRFEWSSFSLRSEEYAGPVYSLGVKRYNHYVADGIVTHNCLYSWRGADPSIFSDPAIPESHRYVLKKSMRVPALVKELSDLWIEGLSDYRKITYEERDGDIGELSTSDATWTHPEPIVDSVLKKYEAGDTVMILATCSYMVRPIVQVLRKRGVPFCNPWRTRRGDWNPLYASRGVSMADRVIDFLINDKYSFPEDPKSGRKRHMMWTPDELKSWCKVLKSQGLMLRGVKTELNAILGEHPRDRELSPDVLFRIFTEEGLGTLGDCLDHDEKDDRDGGQTKRLLAWFKEHLLDSRKKSGAYPLDIINRMGVDGLLNSMEPRPFDGKPHIFVGTIHSFKGSEADNVIIFPDLSPAGYNSWQRKATRDGVIRTFYVGITRAKKSLTICNSSSGMEVKLKALIARARHRVSQRTGG